MDVPVLPAMDILLLSVPFLLILAMGMFGLDIRFANPARGSAAQRSFCEVDGNGFSFLSDPDGKVWSSAAAPTPHQTPADSAHTGDPCGRLRRPVARFYIIEEE